MDIPDKVVAFFAAGVINDHLVGRPGEDGIWDASICGPCASLTWLWTHKPDETSAAIAEHLGTGWDWQIDDKVNWPMLTQLIPDYRQAAKNG